jgi:hypothetical protein
MTSAQALTVTHDSGNHAYPLIGREAAKRLQALGGARI